jgi:hypothetical protein
MLYESFLSAVGSRSETSIHVKWSQLNIFVHRDGSYTMEVDEEWVKRKNAMGLAPGDAKGFRTPVSDAFAPHPPFRPPCITFSPTVSPFWCCRDRRCAPKSAVTEI